MQPRRHLADHRRPTGRAATSSTCRRRVRQQRAAGLGLLNDEATVTMKPDSPRSCSPPSLAVAALAGCGPKRPPNLVDGHSGRGRRRRDASRRRATARARPLDAGPDLQPLDRRGLPRAATSPSGRRHRRGRAARRHLLRVRPVRARPTRRGPTLEKHAHWLRATADGEGHGRGPLRRARHRGVQPGPRRPARARRPRLPREPGRRRGAGSTRSRSARSGRWTPATTRRPGRGTGAPTSRCRAESRADPVRVASAI